MLSAALMVVSLIYRALTTSLEGSSWVSDGRMTSSHIVVEQRRPTWEEAQRLLQPQQAQSSLTAAELATPPPSPFADQVAASVVDTSPPLSPPATALPPMLEVPRWLRPEGTSLAFNAVRQRVSTLYARPSLNPGVW